MKGFDFLRNYNELYKVKFVYEWIIKNIKYGMTDTEGQNVYEALIKRKAVCKGISKAYQLILSRLDVFSILTEGTIGSSQSKHVWNVVKVAGEYYNVDVSIGYKCFSYMYQNNQNQKNPYRGLLLSDDQIEKTHHFIRTI